MVKYLIAVISLLVFIASTSWALTEVPRGTQVNKSHPLARGLVGAWLFNEGTGDKVFDLSGNGNEGTLSDMDSATDWVGGKDGWALDFDGTNDYVLILDDQTLACTDFLTVEMWFNSAVLLDATAEVSRTLEKGNSYFFLQGNGGNTGTGGMNFAVKKAGIIYVAEIGQSLNADQWYHLVSTFNGTNIKVYLDSVLKDTTALSGSIDDNNLPLSIGADDSGKYFNGKIMLTRIYNRALSSSDVQQLYLNPYAMFEFDVTAAIFGDLGTVATSRRRWGM